MTATPMTDASLLFLQAVATLSDTVLMKQVESEPGLFDKVTSIASGLMTISILVLTAALVPAAWNFRKSYAKISDLLDRVYGDINPLMRHASSIADNVDYISTSVRVDIQQVSQTVAAANQKLLQAVDLAEIRINQLNALLEVVQEEAESAFVTTASTLRGVRTGINTAFDQSLAGRDELIDDDELLDATFSDDDEEELIDGQFSEAPPHGGEKPRPRVRPRRGV